MLSTSWSPTRWPILVPLQQLCLQSKKAWAGAGPRVGWGQHMGGAHGNTQSAFILSIIYHTHESISSLKESSPIYIYPLNGSRFSFNWLAWQEARTEHFLRLFKFVMATRGPAKIRIFLFLIMFFLSRVLFKPDQKSKILWLSGRKSRFNICKHLLVLPNGLAWFTVYNFTVWRWLYRLMGCGQQVHASVSSCSVHALLQSLRGATASVILHTSSQLLTDLKKNSLLVSSLPKSSLWWFPVQLHHLPRPSSCSIRAWPSWTMPTWHLPTFLTAGCFSSFQLQILSPRLSSCGIPSLRVWHVWFPVWPSVWKSSRGYAAGWKFERPIFQVFALFFPSRLPGAVDFGGCWSGISR